LSTVPVLVLCRYLKDPERGILVIKAVPGVAVCQETSARDSRSPGKQKARMDAEPDTGAIHRCKGKDFAAATRAEGARSLLTKRMCPPKIPILLRFLGLSCQQQTRWRLLERN